MWAVSLCIRRRQQRQLKLRQKLTYLLMFCCLPHFSSGSPLSPNCRPPCENASCPVMGECHYGTYELCSGCCTACARGLDEICHSYNLVTYGPCGEGMVCAGETIYYPGQCNWIDPPSPTEPVVEPSTSQALSPSLTPSPSSTTSTLPTMTPTSPSITTTLQPTVDPPGDEDMTVCRPACSVEYCSETETRKKRICSGMGLSPVVAGRNKCQHTTCGACFILREPNCTAFACPEPPMKDCLRNFYNCVRDHYFGTNAVSNIIKLEDQLVRTANGRLMCSVPHLDPSGGIARSYFPQGGASSGVGEQNNNTTSSLSSDTPSQQP